MFYFNSIVSSKPINFAVNILGVVGYYYNTNIAECIIKIKSKPSE